MGIYPLKFEYETFTKFTKFCNVILTQFNRRIKKFQCDLGGEFHNTAFRNFAVQTETCAKEAILPELVKAVAVAGEDEKVKVTASTSSKEESNIVGELPDPVKKALDELKVLVQEALNKHEFTAPPTATPKSEETEKPTATPPRYAAEEIPVSPEEVSIWGIPLLADERSDVILLKFLWARDLQVKDSFMMVKNVVAWRKEFGIESLLEEEDLGTEQEKLFYMHGVDKEGHPVCYNAYGEYQNKELYQETFSDEEKRKKFLRWRIQFLEKSIRKLDFSPDGISTIVRINDLKDFTPAYLKKEIQQLFQLHLDNYPDFVAKQVFINVPWWYLAFYKMIGPFFTQRTKSQMVFAGPSKTSETLFK